MTKTFQVKEAKERVCSKIAERSSSTDIDDQVKTRSSSKEVPSPKNAQIRMPMPLPFNLEKKFRIPLPRLH
jgi:hypothetical protein